MRRLLLFLALLACTGSAQAGVILPGSYQLLDHGDGQLGPDYGLRNDALGALFSLELNGASATLTWAGGATASITGTLWEQNAGELWTVTYTITGITAQGSQGFTASGGFGTLTDPLANDFAMLAEQNGAGDAFLFLADGHRLAGDTDTPVGRGWMLPPSSTDDWLFRAAPVPEPSAIAAYGAGLVLVGVVARRRARAA